MVESSCSFPPFVALEENGAAGPAAPGVRWERVTLIRARLAEGRYRVSAAAVSAAIMRGIELPRVESAVESELVM